MDSKQKRKVANEEAILAENAVLKAKIKELQKKLVAADELNREQYDLIIHLGNQIRAYEVMGQVDRLKN